MLYNNYLGEAMSLFGRFPRVFPNFVPFGLAEEDGKTVIDFHTHVLPGIDDGSRDSEMTEALLAEEARQGVDFIVATPHFYANRTSIDRFLQKRDAALARTVELSAGKAFPRLAVGAEVYYFPGIGKAKDISRTAVNGRTLLLEMPFEQWKDGMLRDVNDLRDQGLTVVLAHIERYPEFQSKKDVWDKLMASPVVKQINASSFLKQGGLAGLIRGNRKASFALSFLQDHPETIIGTDCHNMEGRRPKLQEAREAIRRALGAEILSRVDALTESLINNQKET